MWALGVLFLSLIPPRTSFGPSTSQSKRVISDQEAGEERSLSALTLCRGSAHRYQSIVSNQRPAIRRRQQWRVASGGQEARHRQIPRVARDDKNSGGEGRVARKGGKREREVEMIPLSGARIDPATVPRLRSG